MKISHNYPNIFDGRRKYGRTVKKVSKILYPILNYTLLTLGALALIHFFI